MSFDSLVEKLIDDNLSMLKFSSDPDVLKGVKIFQTLIWPKHLKLELPKISLRFPASSVNDVFDSPIVSKGTMSDDPTQSEANFNIELERKDKQFPTKDLDLVYLQKGLKTIQDNVNKLYFSGKEVLNILDPHSSHDIIPGGAIPKLFIPVVIDVQAQK